MVLETDGQHEAYAALRRLTAADPNLGLAREWTPAWSSRVLEETIERIVSRQNSGLRDLFEALWELAGQPDVPLTRTMANFIHDIIVLCFTRYRSQYDAENLSWMVERVRTGCTPSQAYLALLALPEDLIKQCRDDILSGVKETPFFDEVARML
jgi:hypothetical protein